MKPLPEIFDVGEDGGRVGFGKETVVGGDEERRRREAEVEQPMDFSTSCQRTLPCELQSWVMLKHWEICERWLSPRGVPSFVHTVPDDKTAAVPIDENGVVGLRSRL